VRAPEPVAPRAKEPSAGAAPKQAAPVAAASERAPDDLTLIKGIGPVVQQKLHALGIRTFNDLAAADPEALVEQLKGRQPISETLVRGWTKAADQRTAARH
jgi:predicted flap endonuclease-1-like 5' DNA nuclease